MATDYTPDQTRDWSTRELAALIDKQIGVRFRPGAQPQQGHVVDAGIGRSAQAWIEFAGGGSVAWDRDEISIWITVVD
jgi:hypothetical protein